ncbi:MAG: beta-lactamase family protein [Oscillospiraceae bacterium]|nr:beta-lactamase family protein [Oscillospiraceae bacterium]
MMSQTATKKTALAQTPIAIIEETTNSLPRAASPEEVGISSQAILNLLDEYDKQGYEYHGLMILRHGKVAFETYRAPYAKEIPHSIYSFSKSVAATSIGFAVEEGLLSLHDPVGKFFPEYRPKKNAERWDKITIWHVLTMTTGFAFNVFHQNSNPDWVKDYLHSHLRDEPGSVFHYTNENAYLISVLIRRISGQTLFEYLKPRLFDPLGIDVPYSEVDGAGNQGGGWGIIWKLEDSAKFIQCYLNNGKWNGKQIIPEWWAVEATKTQVSNADNIKADSKVGYGYQFWMCSLPNTFACRGMFCQQGVGMRDHDAVFVYVGAEADEQKPYDVIYPHFPAGFLDESEKHEADETVLKELKSRAENLTFPAPPVSKRISVLEEKCNNNVLRLRKHLFLNTIGFPLSLLPMTVNQMALDRAGHIDNVYLDFKENEVFFTWQEGKKAQWINTIPLGLDGKYREGRINLSGFELDTYSYANWEDDKTLLLNIRPIQTCCSRTLRVEFKSHDRVKIIPRSTPSFKSVADNLYHLSHAFLNNSKPLCALSKFLFSIAPAVMEANFHGKLKSRKQFKR